ncbi:MAG: hypothetical protein U0667_06535 [Chloroflexota bacterium]
MGVPDAMECARRPAPTCGRSQTDETEVGFGYAMIDRVLFRLVDRRRTIEEVVAEGFDRATVERVDRLVAGAGVQATDAAHRQVGPRTASVDYLYPRRRPRASAGLRSWGRLAAPCSWWRRPSGTWLTSASGRWPPCAPWHWSRRRTRG